MGGRGGGRAVQTGTDFQFLEVRHSRALLHNSVHRVNTTVPQKRTRMANFTLGVFITSHEKIVLKLLGSDLRGNL